MKHKN